MRVPIVDAHHHLWDLEQKRHPWLLDAPDPDSWLGDVTPLHRSYLLHDYLGDALASEVVASVHVEAGWDPEDPVGETRWLQAVADETGFPHAIIAAAELQASNLEEVLEAHCRAANVRGIRQMLDWGERRQLLESPTWRRGLRRLATYGLSFDLQVDSDALETAARVAADNTDIVFILDHCGMPRDRSQEGLALWRRGLQLLAAQPNVVAKVSGLGMFDHAWTTDSIRPYVDELFTAFGAGRCMFGSNFPVDRLYGSYETLVASMRELTSSLSVAEQHAFFHDNAVRVYRIGSPIGDASAPPAR
ncbi:MAG: amidohydrolase 2 [Acidimicrobiaceae bacterium]|nr:amidohydrolase 2 [Acidimicrobiaceae bacterium]